MTTVLLTGAGGSAASNFHDALRRSNRSYRVVGADSSPIHLHLSTANDRVVIPRADDPSYGDALREVIEQWEIDVVHPQPDPEVLAVGAMRQSLPAATLLPSQQALRIAADKVAFSAAMVASNVAVPDSVHYADMDSIPEITADLLGKYGQVWVRARVGAGARASLPVRLPEQASAWVRWWVDEKGMSPGEFMASEMLPGREFAYQSVWQDGELVAGQLRERLEYLYGHLTPSGQTSTPAVARTVKLPAIDSLAMDAIVALDATPQGAYCVDIKESFDGVPKVTEINAGRFFTTSNFFAAAGLNMPDLLIRCALGERPERTESSPLPTDLYWIRMVDMLSVLVHADELDTWSRPHTGL